MDPQFGISNKQEISSYVETEINGVSLHQLLSKGLAKLYKTQPEQAVEWLANFLLENNPNTPNVKVQKASEQQALKTLPLEGLEAVFVTGSPGTHLTLQCDMLAEKQNAEIINLNQLIETLIQNEKDEYAVSIRECMHTNRPIPDQEIVNIIKKEMKKL